MRNLLREASRHGNPKIVLEFAMPGQKDSRWRDENYPVGPYLNDPAFSTYGFEVQSFGYHDKLACNTTNDDDVTPWCGRQLVGVAETRPWVSAMWVPRNGPAPAGCGS